MGIATIKQTLSDNFLECKERIHGVLCAPLAGQHVLLLGPPATAKSQLAGSLCASISGPATSSGS